jgi:hypothetical protein
MLLTSVQVAVIYSHDDECKERLPVVMKHSIDSVVYSLKDYVHKIIASWVLVFVEGNPPNVWCIMSSFIIMVFISFLIHNGQLLLRW